MPLVRRHLFTVLSVLSLLLFVVPIVLWVLTDSTWLEAQRIDERDLEHSASYYAACFHGSVWLYHEGYNARMRQNRGPALYSGTGFLDGAPLFALADNTAFEEGSARYRHYWLFWHADGPWGDGGQLMVFPAWILLVATLILPVVGIVRWRRRARRRGRSLCIECGYNLTANTSGVCPECGTPTTAGVKA